MKLEKWDQYLLLPVIIIAWAILWAKWEITNYLVMGFLIGLIGLAAFNKGRKSNVNLKTDITYIALALILLSVAGYYLIFIRFELEILILFIILIAIIAILHE